MPSIDTVFRYLRRTGWTQMYGGALVVFKRAEDYLNIYRSDPVDEAVEQIARSEQRTSVDVLRDVWGVS
jgi:hypothetical protein